MIRQLALFLMLMTALRAVELPGTWSNGQSEFYTISLQLRADGQALFATAVLPGFGLWEKTDSGLLFTLYEGGQSLALPFTYDPATELLTGKFQGTEVVLKKTSNEEAPDILAMIQESAAEEEEYKRKTTRFEYRTFANRKALRVFLEEWTKSDERKRAKTIFLSAGEGETQLTVRDWGSTCGFKVLLESRRLATLSGYPLGSKRLPDDTVSDLPIVYELQAAQRKALAKLAQTSGVKGGTLAIGQFSIFKAEGFVRQLEFAVTPDMATDALTLADQLLDIIWETSPREIRAELQFRVYGTISAD